VDAILDNPHVGKAMDDLIDADDRLWQLPERVRATRADLIQRIETLEALQSAQADLDFAAARLLVTIARIWRKRLYAP
jgi:hypothetical protein